MSLRRQNRVDLKTASPAGLTPGHQILFARNQLQPQFDVNFALARRETTDTLVRSFGFDQLPADDVLHDLDAG